MTRSKPSRRICSSKRLRETATLRGKGAGPDQGHIALLYNRLNAFGGQAVKCRSGVYRCDEIAPCFLGIGFEFIAIHVVLALGLTDFYALVSGQGVGQFPAEVRQGKHPHRPEIQDRMQFDELDRGDDPPVPDHQLVLHRPYLPRLSCAR